MYSKQKRNTSQISNEAFKKLAKNNVKKSMKDYMIYFITLAFGAALLYSFNAIDNVLSSFMNDGLLDAYINMSRGVLGMFSIIICIIFGFLITYSNNFLMKKRKREFGIYTTLGMNKSDINKLMFRETSLIGILSLGIGLVFGIFASQGLSIITFKMIGLDMSNFGFSISVSAVIKTILLFGFVLWLVNKFNEKNINNYKLIDLITAHRKNEKSMAENGAKSLLIFGGAIILILGAYALLKTLSSPNTILISLGIVGIALGTYLFFISVSDFVLEQVKKNEKVYYNKLTMFVIGQFSGRIRTMSLSITVICLILSSALIIMPFGMGYAEYFKQGTGVIAPFDGTVVRYNQPDNGMFYDEQIYSDSKALNKQPYVTLEEALIKGRFPYKELVEDSTEVKLYLLKNITYSKLTNQMNNEKDYEVSIISVTDYNKVRAKQGLETINLDKDSFAVNGAGPKTEEILEQLISSQPALNINNHTLKLTQVYSGVYYFNSNMVSSQFTIVVPDDVVANLHPIITYLNVEYPEGNSKYDTEMALAIADFKSDYDLGINFDSKLVIDGEKTAFNIVFSFVAIYLGVILLISAGAILALQQIAESATDKKRFEVLRKLGVKQGDMEKAMGLQVAIFFMMPLVLAFMHAVCITNVLYSMALELSGLGLIRNIGVSLIIVVVIYGSYFYVSHQESLNLIKNKK